MAVNVSNLSTSGLSSLRLNGLSSGLDTESIVKSLLQIDQLKVDKQFKFQTKLEWKSDALREVNTMLKNFRQENLSVLNASSNMLSTDTYKTNTVSILSNSSAVSIQASAQATATTMAIDSITQLATNATIKGNAAFGTDITMTTALSELAFTNALEFVGGEISFSINGTEFTFSQTDTLGDVISQVNASDAGVTMRYSSLSRGFYIASTDTGSASEVNIVNTSGNAFASSNSAFGIAQGTVNGQDAILSIDGTTVVESANTFTIDGISYTLKNTSATPISFSVQRDIDGIYQKVSNFVKSYNTLITALHDKIGEDTYSDFAPLTDTEKAALSESQIDKWEAKAKSGLLRHDSNIRSFLSSMRNAFYTSVSSAGISASEIGLTTESYTTTGEIQIDENALKEALQANPDQVIKLFTSTSESTDGATNFSESGLVTRISNAMLNYTNTSTDVTLNSLSTQMEQASGKLSDLEDWLADQESHYYSKFSAMESALATMNSNSSWLSSMIGSLGSGGNG